MKEQLLHAMKLMYPNGVNSAQQHRDVIRVYVVAWGDALKYSGSLIALEAHKEECLKLSDPNWWPDNSWVWWV